MTTAVRQQNQVFGTHSQLAAAFNSGAATQPVSLGKGPVGDLSGLMYASRVNREISFRELLEARVSKLEKVFEDNNQLKDVLGSKPEDQVFVDFMETLSALSKQLKLIDNKLPEMQQRLSNVLGLGNQLKLKHSQQLQQNLQSKHTQNRSLGM